MAHLPYRRSYDQITRKEDSKKLENNENKRLDAARYCLLCRFATKEYCIRCKEPFCSIDCSFKGYLQHKGNCILSSWVFVSLSSCTEMFASLRWFVRLLLLFRRPHTAMDGTYLNQLNNSRPYYEYYCDSVSNSATSSTSMSIGSDEDCSKVFSKNNEQALTEKSEIINEQSNRPLQVGDCLSWSEMVHALKSMEISEGSQRPTNSTFPYPIPQYLSKENRVHFQEGKPVEVFNNIINLSNSTL